MQPLEKQIEGRGLGLRWPPFEHTTQQPTKSPRSPWGGYSGGRATWTERVGVTIVWGGELASNKYKCKNMSWPYTAADGYLKSNNQPKTGSRDGGKHGVEMRRAGRVGEARYHHFGGVVIVS